jgi:hypothetical protein
MGETGKRQAALRRDARLRRMDMARAERLVTALRDRGVMAHVARQGVFRIGIRVVIPDGREALWDTDGAAGLEAQIMRDGVLVGFVPEIAGSESYDDDAVVATIAASDYGAVQG